MIFTLITFTLLAILRGAVATHVDIFPWWSSHIGYLIPDLLFFVYLLFWFFIKEKKPISPGIVIFFLAYLGSIVWDYQDGFYFLKFLAFPGVLFLLLNPHVFDKASIVQAILYSFPIFQNPFGSIKQFFSYLLATSEQKIVPKEHTTTEEPIINFSLSKAIWAGMALGIVILITLAQLDPDFASFLSIAKWWDVIVNSFFGLLFYLFIFFWYFWKPVHTAWNHQPTEIKLNSLLHWAVVMIVGIVIGYALYDTYIVLRVFKLIQLTFETIGKNAQLNFLEMVIMGGAWLFLAVFVLNRLKDQLGKQHKAIQTIFILLLLSSIWLIPPVMNILRVLLSVYIPQFGLTARRLFGIYTTFAFFAAFVTLFWCVLRKHEHIFTRVIVHFFLVLIFLSFVSPTNILIGQWHFNQYLKGEKADFEYFRKVKLEKWGWIFTNQLQQREGGEWPYKSDAVWGLMLANRMRNQELQDKYQTQLIKYVESEVSDITKLLQAQQISTFVERFGDNNYWYMNQSSSSQIQIDSVSSPKAVAQSLKNAISEDNYLLEDYLYPNQVNVNFSYSYLVQPTNPTTTTGAYRQNRSVTTDFEFNYISQPRQELLKLKDEVTPLWVKNLDSKCKNVSEKSVYDGTSSCFYMTDICAEYKRATLNKPLVYPTISKEFVDAFVTIGSQANYCGD